MAHIKFWEQIIALAIGNHQKVSEQGHRVIITIGRPLSNGISYPTEELGLESPMINCNALTPYSKIKMVRKTSMTLDKDTSRYGREKMTSGRLCAGE